MFPNQFETARLLLRPIEPGHAVAIFEGYAQDPAVTRDLAWCPHLSIGDTQAYIASCLGEAPLRTYVLLEPKGGQLLGCLEMCDAPQSCSSPPGLGEYACDGNMGPRNSIVAVLLWLRELASAPVVDDLAGIDVA